MRGADVIANALKAEGVEFVAGVTGGSTMAIYDALHSLNMRILVCRNERGAADIADGFARITARPGAAHAPRTEDERHCLEGQTKQGKRSGEEVKE
jgi:acetolactate synthase-1/2/3 large subunit